MKLEFIIRENTQLFGEHFNQLSAFYTKLKNIRNILSQLGASADPCAICAFFFISNSFVASKACSVDASIFAFAAATRMHAGARCGVLSAIDVRRVAGYWYRYTRRPGNARRYIRVPLTCPMRSAFALSRGRLLEKAVCYMRESPAHCDDTERISQWCNKHDKCDKKKY